MSCDLSRRSFRIRNLPCRFRLYLRVWIPSLPLRRLVGLFRCRFDQCNVQACALAACTVSVISINAFAYLPGLHAARPSAFVERWRSRTACSSKLFRESSPLWSDAVALVSAMGQAFPLFQCCRFAPTIPAFTSQICLS